MSSRRPIGPNPLPQKNWSVCAGINFFDFAKNGVFQQYGPKVDTHLADLRGNAASSKQTFGLPFALAPLKNFQKRTCSAGGRKQNGTKSKIGDQL